MIQIEKLSFSFQEKEIFNNISFSIENNMHYALIGSNGVGKSTLVDMIINPEKYIFDGKIIKAEDSRIGYATQFCIRDKTQDCTVFEYLSEKFLENETKIDAVCNKMGEAENIDILLKEYQDLLDLREAMDGENYESNIHKQLHVAGMTYLKDIKLSKISGGEYKVLQIMREMLLSPNTLILDEPDVFLDFANLNSLCSMINGYNGTLIVITHNRYLLNHCFNGILHLENAELNQFKGSYTEYRCWQIREKMKLQEQCIEEHKEIIRTQKMVNILRKRATEMVNPDIGKTVNAKQSQLDRLKARHIKAPFIEIREPGIEFPCVDIETDELGNIAKYPVLTVKDYRLEYDECLLENVSFELMSGDKIAVVGRNGTGKTSMIKDILNNSNSSISINSRIKYACLSQLQGNVEDEALTVLQAMQDAGFHSEEDIILYLSMYCLEEIDLKQRLGQLSGGEQNLLQIAIIAASDAELLILDEPTCQLDIYAQTALEKAVSEFKGTVLMVSHDFYLVSNCADYVLYMEDNTIRKMRNRKFRKMVYDKYFNQKYLELDKKKQELEVKIDLLFRTNDFVNIEKLCSQLEKI